MKRLVSLTVFLSLFSVIFHFHADFSYHSDCPACVFEIDDDKIVEVSIKYQREELRYSFEYFFLKKENSFINIPKKPFSNRAPPKTVYKA